jgi:hypothetical protein
VNEGRIVNNGHARTAAWVVLAFAAITMVAFNCFHALHSGLPEWPLAVLVGVAPVILVMGMSHLVAAHHGGWFLKGVTFAAMIGAMLLSVTATGYVVRPVLGPLWWLYGAVVDSSAMVALQVIMTPASQPASITAEPAADITAETADVSPPVSARVSPPVSPHVSDDPDIRAAHRAYRKSVRDGKPLSQRALAAMYGHSQPWGKARIDEVKNGPATVAAAR